MLWWQLRSAMPEVGNIDTGSRFRFIRLGGRRSSTPGSRDEAARRVKVSAPKALIASGSVVLVVVAAAAGWMLTQKHTVTHRTAGARSPAAATSYAPAATRVRTAAAARPLKPASAVSFGPDGYGKGDNNRLAPLAIDTSLATAWRTGWYASPHFGNLQSGTGLLLDMGRTVTVTSVRLWLTSARGADFQLRLGAAAFR